MESWKILSQNIPFLKLKNPGKFCPDKRLSWNFLKIFSLKICIPGIYSHRIFHSWNLFWSWNFLFLESYFTEFTCYQYVSSPGIVQPRPFPPVFYGIPLIQGWLFFHQAQTAICNPTNNHVASLTPTKKHFNLCNKAQTFKTFTSFWQINTFKT